MTLHCKFSGDCNSERIFKVVQYLTKLCVEHLGFTFLAHPVCHAIGQTCADFRMLMTRWSANVKRYRSNVFVRCVAAIDTVDTCPHEYELCSNWENCIRPSQFCNGVDNCFDNWDEDDSVCGQSFTTSLQQQQQVLLLSELIIYMYNNNNEAAAN